MTIPEQDPRISYVGDGSTTSFAYNWKILDASHIEVVKLTISTGVEVVLSSGFTVDGVNNPSGGNVNFSVAPTSDEKVTFTLDVSFDQVADYVNGNGFPADDHEDQMDRITQMAQVTRILGQRSVKVSKSTPTTFDATLPDVTGQAGRALKINATEDGLIFSNADIDDLDTAIASTQASAAAAATSESNAATSESNAATSESNAATSESNAATSEANAAASALSRIVDNAVLWLDMDDVSGAIAEEVSNETVAVAGGYSLSSASPVSAGMGQYLTCSTNVSQIQAITDTKEFKPGLGITFGCWFYITSGHGASASTEPLTIKDSGGTVVSFDFDSDAAGTTDVRIITNSGDSFTKVAITADQWIFLVGVVTGDGQSTLYEDGSSIGTGTHDRLDVASTGIDCWQVSQSAATPGEMRWDGIFCINRVLNATQIAHIYNSGSGRKFHDSTLAG